MSTHAERAAKQRAETAAAFDSRRSLFGKLSPRQRQAVEMRISGSLVREIGIALGIGTKSIENALVEAKVRLGIPLRGIRRRAAPTGIPEEVVSYPQDVERPKTRGDCIDGPRPCPFVSCSSHLYLDVSPRTGAIKINSPGLEVWEMRETCSLDVADRGDATLDQVGHLMNLTRERVRQIEVAAIGKIHARVADLRDGSPPAPPAPVTIPDIPPTLNRH